MTIQVKVRNTDTRQDKAVVSVDVVGADGKKEKGTKEKPAKEPIELKGKQTTDILLEEGQQILVKIIKDE